MLFKGALCPLGPILQLYKRHAPTSDTNITHLPDPVNPATEWDCAENRLKYAPLFLREGPLQIEKRQTLTGGSTLMTLLQHGGEPQGKPCVIQYYRYQEIKQEA